MVLVPGPRWGKEQCRDGAGPRHVLGPDLREVDSVDSASVDTRAGGEICAWGEGRQPPAASVAGGARPLARSVSQGSGLNTDNYEVQWHVSEVSPEEAARAAPQPGHWALYRYSSDTVECRYYRYCRM